MLINIHFRTIIACIGNSMRCAPSSFLQRMVMDMHMNRLAIGIPLLAIGFAVYYLSSIYGAGELEILVSTIVYGAGQGLAASSINFEKPGLIPLRCRDSFIVLLLFPIFLYFPGVGYTVDVMMGLVLGLFIASNASRDTESK